MTNVVLTRWVWPEQVKHHSVVNNRRGIAWVRKAVALDAINVGPSTRGRPGRICWQQRQPGPLAAQAVAAARAPLSVLTCANCHQQGHQGQQALEGSHRKAAGE